MLKSLIISLILLSHPDHVSLLGVEFSIAKNTFSVSLKMDYDDFKTDYWYSINDDLVFDTSGKIDTTVVLISQYLGQKVQIFADDKQLKWKIVKFELAEGELRIDLLFRNIKGAKNFRVKNLILANVFKDQSNLLIFKYGEIEEAVKLSANKQEHAFSVK